ncbi:MAG: cupin domain-containing protein [Pseudomonadota bacterium]
MTKALDSSLSQRILWLLLGVGLTVTVFLAYEALHYTRKGHSQRPPVAEGQAKSAVDDQVNSAWVLEGTPRLQTTHFFKTSDGKISAGLWEATGPAKFEWHYGTDETVLVLEGGAKLTYNGTTREVGPGQSIYFPAKAVVVWEVPARIKKTWVLHEPGRVARRLRPLLGG